MTERLFYLPQLQENYWGLKDLIHKSEATGEIAYLSKNEKFMQRPSKDAPYFNRWHIVLITLTHPFYSILSIFTSAAALLSYCLFAPSVARVFTVLSKQLTRDWQQVCAQWEFKAPLMMPSLNAHQLTSWDLYEHGDVPYDSIKDEMVKPLTFQSTEFRAGVKEAMDSFYLELESNRYAQSWLAWMLNHGRTVSSSERRSMTTKVLNECKVGREEAIATLKGKYYLDDLERPIQAFYGKLREVEARMETIPNVALFSEQGNCRGGSLWFIYLLFRTQNLFTDRSKHIEAVAQQFSTGMPRQAALLQALDNSDDLLKMQREEFTESSITLYELDDNRPSALAKIEELPEGVYRVGVHHHSLVYIKNKNDTYVWDPTFGLYAMDPSEMLGLIKKHYHSFGHPESSIYFHRYVGEAG
ncbi:MAG: hypothetical protein P0S96_04295 [Simkaniaceae bacterium]|nr:hypothetical protein [Candidatus Sacchlamyda saccharinae]